MKIANITWEPKKVKVADLQENENNPKILTEKGKNRFQTSLSKFGLAGTIVCNKDLSIIDGHSRKIELVQQGVKEVWVSVPSRQLTDKEFREFNAIFDIAKAGDPDIGMIEEILGEDNLEEWDLITDKGSPTGKSPGVYPIVPEYDESYEAIVIICSKELDTTFIKNALGMEKAKSYKNSMVKETSILTAEQFIQKWNEKLALSSPAQEEPRSSKRTATSTTA